MLARLFPGWIIALVAACIIVVAGTFIARRLAGAGAWNLPVPFPSQSTGNGFTASTMVIGRKNDIPVAKVTLEASGFEPLTTGTIYLIPVPSTLPKDANGMAAPVTPRTFDEAINTAGPTLRPSMPVQFFGYKYSDALASQEKAHANDADFKARFPGLFFASKAQRDADGSIAAFERATGVTFHPTDGSADAVGLEPASLYVIVINAPMSVFLDAHPR